MWIKQLFGVALALLTSGATLADTNPATSPLACGGCHTRIFQEWKSSGMGTDLDNKMVYQFYTGTNGKGEKDGVGFQPFTHGEIGDCADCHVPQLVIDEHKQGRQVDLGIAMKEKLDHGISCNWCHTMQHVNLDKGADGRYKTRVFDTVVQDLSGAKHGPRKDAKSPAHPTKFNPLMKDSKQCGTCHLNQEKFLSISAYDDWKEAFDAGKTKDTCQTCHMPLHKGKVELAVGGPKRAGVRSHTFIGAHDEGMLNKALSLKVDTQTEGGLLTVKTVVENIGAGHKVPGSGPIRNVILKVDVTDEAGKTLEFAGDPKALLPGLAGMGNPKTKERDAQDWMGMPGKMYAKVYQSAVMPDGKKMIGVGGFAADSILFDTALKMNEPDTAQFKFKLPEGYNGKVKVNARLVYRWVFKPLADRKGWKVDDRPMGQVEKMVAVKL
jgi:hypothetical protein